jgi:phospholipid transport system transporter-binding protein
MYRPVLKLTFNEAGAALEAGLRAIAEGQTRIDLGDLSLVDSAAIAAMLAWQRAAHSQGKSLAFSNPPANLQSLLQLYGVSELLNIAPAFEARHDLPHH